MTHVAPSDLQPLYKNSNFFLVTQQKRHCLAKKTKNNKSQFPLLEKNTFHNRKFIEKREKY